MTNKKSWPTIGTFLETEHPQLGTICWFVGNIDENTPSLFMVCNHHGKMYKYKQWKPGGGDFEEIKNQMFFLATNDFFKAYNGLPTKFVQPSFSEDELNKQIQNIKEHLPEIVEMIKERQDFYLHKRGICSTQDYDNIACFAYANYVKNPGKPRVWFRIFLNSEYEGFDELEEVE